MADLLPPFAGERRALSGRLLEHFGLSGYALVTPPLFEHAVVVERGNDLHTARGVLRFVEPETGEVAVLRPDITPQVARIAATRLTDRPAPHRLCYEGRVLRRPLGRARMHRQVAQVGVECIGIASPIGDVETIGLACSACETVGLKDYRVELCTSALVLPALSALPSQDIRDEVARLVATKDTAALRAMAAQHDLPDATVQRLEALIDHYGDLTVLDSARRVFTDDAAQAALTNLAAICAGLTERGSGAHLRVDLGETRGRAYYTGASFQILADGPGQAIGRGGRYDNLLGHFGAAQPATGFALSVDNLQWALQEHGIRYRDTTAPRFVVSGTSSTPELDAGQPVAQRLREAGFTAATLPHSPSADQALAFAKSWGYHAAVVVADQGMHALRTADGATRALQTLDSTAITGLVEWACASED